MAASRHARLYGRGGVIATAATLTLISVVSLSSQSAPAGAAYGVVDLNSSRTIRQARPEILDTPVLPGSVMKAVTLVAALESGALGEGATHLCRRDVTVDGVRYVCSHPDLRRPLTPAEALAHSCNHFFLSLAPRLSRDAVNAARRGAGLPPLAATTPLAAALVGLDGPRVTPRAIASAFARLAGVGRDAAAPMRPATRQVLLEGLRGAATFGTASALGDRGVSALAKTGTAPMPGGGVMGLVVALAPAARPVRSVVVVAPGAAGLDAATIAADVLADARQPAGIRLGRSLPNGRSRAETVAVDDYVAQVVAAEGQSAAAAAAQQALAIAARTYALANRGRHRADGFDLCDSTHCQVVRPPTEASRRAAIATAGRVLLHQGTVAPVFHSAWCGGHPERASEVWPGADTPGRAPATDDACAGEPGWRSEVRVADLERALRAAGLRGDRLTDLRVVARSRSGRAARLRAQGLTPPEVDGEVLRTAVGRTLGWQLLKSTLFDVERTSSGYRFTGRGFGHGVGLCVLGAGRRAAGGATVESILGFYFPDYTIGRSPELDDVALSLPAAEESERTMLTAMVRSARDDIARRAGVSVPAIIRVTVHPTIEAFTRATGQPWYASGATRGTDVDLIPLAFLRKDGQLPRVIRHELAHVLLDDRLAGRALWVREGAARHFSADERARSASPAGASCPADGELRHAPSADALRDAHVRAEACFARALAAGPAWHAVK
jgi:stage II sporulation protein D